MSDAHESVMRNIQRLHDEMQSLALEAGIPAERFAIPTIAMDAVPFEMLSRELEFLEGFRNGAYEDARAFKALKPEEWWNNLRDLFPRTEFVERTMLKEKFARMRKEWVRHYGRVKPAPVQSRNRQATQGVQLRSAE